MNSISINNGISTLAGVSRPRLRTVTGCTGVCLRSAALLFCAFLLMAAGGCRSSRHADIRPTENVAVHPGKMTRQQKRIAEEAMSWMGTPYKYGASEKGVGTDCSGMVLKVYEMAANRKLPRNSARQAEFCRKIKAKDVRVGDLVFFATGRDPDVVSHVGIMLDEENFIHASTKKGVVVSNVATPYYARTFIMYGRVDD